MADSNSIKLCECGCGKPAPIAKRNEPRCGHVAGRPIRYINGHNGVLNRKHGHARTRIKHTPSYGAWESMKKRCTNPNHKDWPNYGGRNIKVCKRWGCSFQAFLDDMGTRPMNMTLDRRDNNRGYYKSNCRWASNKTQQNNKANNRNITAFSRTQTLQQWCDELGMCNSTIIGRIKRGWPIEKALITPPRKMAKPRH